MPLMIAPAIVACPALKMMLLIQNVSPKNTAMKTAPAITPRSTGFFSENRAVSSPAASAKSATETP